MKKAIAYFIIIMIFLLFSVSSRAASELSRQFIEERLVEEGLDKAQVQSMINDPRISLQPDIVIQNLFYASPKGTEEDPMIMRIDPRHIENGRAFIKEYAESLSYAEKRFGTSPRIITAILIVESRLGTYPMRYNVVTAYANMGMLLNPDYFSQIQQAYADKYPLLHDQGTIARAYKRAHWALSELYHLALIANNLGIDPLNIMGSFAGALGPAQFIPSTFRNYGVDGDGDGIIDPFNMKDAIATMGNYLKSSGWFEYASIERKRDAVWHYNHSQVYVNTVMMLYEELGKHEEESQHYLADIEVRLY
ncbi:MAG: lytic murein transglycosylase [Smithellaceae bacterium]